MLVQNLHIRRHERGLVFRRGDLERVLAPGTYRRVPLIDWIRKVKVEAVSVLGCLFQHRWQDALLKDEALKDALHIVDLADDQRALGWKDGRLAWILGPGRTGFWKEPCDLEFETFDIGEDAAFRHPKRDAILGHEDAPRAFAVFDVKAGHEVLVFQDGEFIARAREGRLVFWRDQRKLQVYAIDLREETLDVAGQEIMTRDKVTLRVNLAVTYRIVDPVKTVTVSIDTDKAIYREAQLALRAAIGTRQLDALLADKALVGGEVEQALAQRVASFGVEIVGVGLRDVILPGDMRALMNRVVEAQKEAEANLIRRREETAAARSQANTARLLAENPVLARMKELEMLQSVLAGAKATFVLGRGDLASQLRTLIASDGVGESDST